MATAAVTSSCRLTVVPDHQGVKVRAVNNCTTACPVTGVTWGKSTYSNPCGSCVEVAQLADGRIAVRNSRDPGGPAMIYPRAEMAAFIHGITVGEFDDTTTESMR